MPLKKKGREKKTLEFDLNPNGFLYEEGLLVKR